MRPTASYPRQRSTERNRSAERKLYRRDGSITRLGSGSGFAGGAIGYGSLYGFKAAVAVIVFYFGVKMLVQFEEILLPFIMALLLVSVLEPVKQVWMEVLECTLVLLFQNVSVFRCCLRPARKGNINSLNESNGKALRRGELHEWAKRILLVVSIFITICLAGRCFWLVARIVWLSGEAVTHDFEYYQQGVEKRGSQVQHLLKQFHVEKKAHVDMEDMCNMALELLRYAAEFLTKQAIYTLTQVCLTVIFVLFLLYSPVQRDFSPVTRGVFESMELYLKLKTLISLMMGITNGIALAVIGLELPAAWGLMTFLANFIPNVGGPLMSILPCVIALLDVRKSFFQVSVAFLAQFFLHFNIANFVEPIIFGTTKDIHSVVVLLGLSFFGYIWGFTGMFLSVPLLFAMHAWLDVTVLSLSTTSEAREDARFLMGMLEGRWLGDGEPEEDSTEEQPASSVAVGGSGVVPAGQQQQLEEQAAYGQEEQRADIDLGTPGYYTGDMTPPGSQTAGLVGPGVAVQCSLTELPVSNWALTGALQETFSVRHPETQEVQCKGLLLRWILLAGIGLLIFQWDLHALIYPSGAGEAISSTGHSAAGAAAPAGPVAVVPDIAALPKLSTAVVTTTAAAAALTTEAAVEVASSVAAAARNSFAAAASRGALPDAKSNNASRADFGGGAGRDALRGADDSAQAREDDAGRNSSGALRAPRHRTTGLVA